jgi:DNA-binding Lrp family transcriptional regulator
MRRPFRPWGGHASPGPHQLGGGAQAGVPAPAASTRRRSVLVVTAYILIQTEVGKAAQVAKEIAEIKGVQQAEDVTGPYDVIVRAEARNVDDLGKLVVARVQAVDGITRTLTCPVVHL